MQVWQALFCANLAIASYISFVKMVKKAVKYNEVKKYYIIDRIKTVNRF